MVTGWRRIGFLFFGRALLFFALVFNAKADDVTSGTKLLVAPPSAWVKPHFFDRQVTLQSVDANLDQHWLLLERQINVASNETFVHCVRQILTASGVQSGSTLKADFNPGYQTLNFHWARVWRGANHLNRLDADKVSIVRQERDLNGYILDGEQTAVLVMEDVRAGDIVDYAYSIKGANPVFNGRFSSDVAVQLAEPVDRLLTRVVWPAQRYIYIKPQHGAAQPAVISNKEFIECVWDLKNVPAIYQEDALPAWFDPESWVQLSEFKTWADVNQWAMTLFQNTSPLSPELMQKIGEWKHLDNPEQQVLAALRFVQDEIRYFGVEIGMNSHRPADATTVFGRRYGDCKDKSLLFVTLLRNLGIEAYPALVNTEARRSIEEWQPTANAFDHCIAFVRLKDGEYWLDPTANFQRGPLNTHYLSDYGCGLVISPRTTSLTAIPQTTGLPTTTTTEYFSLGEKNGPSTLKVVTVAEGRDADYLRAMLAATKREDLEKYYTHFYSDIYPDIHMTAPIAVDDNEFQNRIQTTEFYKIEKIWKRSDSDGKYRCEFYPYVIADLIKKPVDVQRTLPLGVDYPQHQILRTEITLPTTWNFDNENKTIQDPAFIFHKQANYNGRTISIQYEYQSLADTVSAERAAEYFQQQSKVAKTFGGSLVWK